MTRSRSARVTARRPLLRLVLGSLALSVLLVGGGPWVAVSVAQPDQTAQPDETAQPSPAGVVAVRLTDGWLRPGQPIGVQVEVPEATGSLTLAARLLGPVDDLDDLVAGVEPRAVVHRWPAVETTSGTTAELSLATEPSDAPTTGGDDSAAAPVPGPGLYGLAIEVRGPDGSPLGSDRALLVADVASGLTLALVTDLELDAPLEPDGTRRPDPAAVERAVGTIDFLARHDRLPIGVRTTASSVSALVDTADPVVGAAVERLSRVARDRLLATPATHVDPDSLADAGLGGLLPALVDLGATKVQRALGLTTDSDDGRAAALPWLAVDALGPAGAAALGRAGVDTVLVDAAMLATSNDVDDATPAVVRGGGGLTGIVIDPFLGEQLLAAGPDADEAASADDAAVADVAARRVAAILARFDPDDPTRVVGRLDGPSTPDPLADRVFDLVADAEVALDLVSVTDLADRRSRGTLTLRSVTAESLGQVADDLRTIADRLDPLRGLVGERAPAVVDVEGQVAAAVAHGRTPAERAAATAVVNEVIDRTLAAVSLSGETTVTLSSRRGTLPISIHNDTGGDVRVLVRVRSERLAFPEGDEVVATVDETGRIDVEVESRATGSLPTFVELRTPDGSLLLDEVQFNVRSTAISGVGLMLSIGALVVLAAWWFRHWRAGRAAP